MRYVGFERIELHPRSQNLEARQVAQDGCARDLCGFQAVNYKVLERRLLGFLLCGTMADCEEQARTQKHTHTLWMNYQ